MTLRIANSFKSVFATVVVACALTFAAASPARAQVDKWGAWENGVTEAWWMSSNTFTNDDVTNAIARWKQIGEVSSAGWEGDYFSGSEVHGTYVRWSATGGFIIADVDKCQALVMAVTYGRVKAGSDVVQFIPEFSKSSKSHGHHNREREDAVLNFIPVKWRNSLWLIRQKELSDFTDYAAGLGDFNVLIGSMGLSESHFYSKSASNSALTEAIPLLPGEYQGLVKRPIIGKIVAVVGRKLQRQYSYEFKSKLMSSGEHHDLASLTIVKVNIGKVHGAKKDLLLRVIEPNLGENVRLIDVGQESSTAVLVRGVENGKETYYDNNLERETTYPRAAIGWRLTTALPE